MDFLSNSSGRFTKVKTSDILGEPNEGGKERTAVWNTARVEKLLDQIKKGEVDIRGLRNSPFKENNKDYKKPFIIWEYTPEEMEELRKCKADPIYFADNYASIMTPDGIRRVKEIGGLRDYQYDIIKGFASKKMNILMASRQIGKSVMAGIYIVWYLLFHSDKAALAVADIAKTTAEIVEKMKIIIENLPFFMKPGMINNNVMSMEFDNGSRLIGRTTTKKAGIGLSINLLYMDEFAHIDPGYLEFFYRAIYPTISNDPNAKIIITSTPNGMNMFYELWMAAIKGENSYYPQRVDWWQVPGRDEEWKKQTIADLNSEESFNQEYGLQFFSSDRLLLNSKDLRKVFGLQSNYVAADWILPEEWMNYFDEDKFKLHPSFAKKSLSEIRAEDNYYIFSVDTADGVGGDYSVINIFKVAPLPLNSILKKKDHIRNEYDIFSLIQVAQYRTNKIDINEFSNVVEFLAFNIFDPERVRIIIEMNHKGEIVENRLEENENFWRGMFISSKHTEAAKNFKPGVKLGTSNKIKYCERLRYYIALNKILPNSKETVLELGAFGKSKTGSYRSQTGNDDLAMSCVNASVFFSSPQYYEICSEIYDRLDSNYKKRLLTEVLEVNYRDHSPNSNVSMNAYKDLNREFSKGSHHNLNNKNSVFDIDTLEKIKRTQRNFNKH